MRDEINRDSHPDDDRVVEILMAKRIDGIRIFSLARWQAHQGRWIHEWTGRPMLEAVEGWRERICCACKRA
jgi:hypothetical protein